MNQRRWVPDSKSRALRVPRARNFVLCRWRPGDGHRFAHSRSQRQKKRKRARLRRRQEKNNSVKCASPALRWSARAAPSDNFGGRFFHASTAMMLAFLVSCVDRTDQPPDGRQTLPWDYCRVAREIGEIGLGRSPHIRRAEGFIWRAQLAKAQQNCSVRLTGSQ